MIKRLLAPFFVLALLFGTAVVVTNPPAASANSIDNRCPDAWPYLRTYQRVYPQGAGWGSILYVWDYRWTQPPSLGNGTQCSINFQHPCYSDATGQYTGVKSSWVAGANAIIVSGNIFNYLTWPYTGNSEIALTTYTYCPNSTHFHFGGGTNAYCTMRYADGPANNYCGPYNM